MERIAKFEFNGEEYKAVQEVIEVGTYIGGAKRFLPVQYEIVNVERGVALFPSSALMSAAKAALDQVQYVTRD